MRVLLVSSPGAGSGPHWSHTTARELAAALQVGQAQVHWFAVADADRAPQRPATGEFTFVPLPARALHEVAAGADHTAFDVVLTKELRIRPAAAVVHLGLGARGSGNVAWIADRMGSVTFAVARASEVVCQRGDLIDWTGQPCAIFDDPERCRRCCTASWLHRARAGAFRDRLDLLVAGLQVCNAVFVRSEAEVAMLERIGVQRRLLQVVAASDVAAIAARILAPRTAAGAPA